MDKVTNSHLYALRGPHSSVDKALEAHRQQAEERQTRKTRREPEPPNYNHGNETSGELTPKGSYIDVEV